MPVNELANILLIIGWVLMLFWGICFYFSWKYHSWTFLIASFFGNVPALVLFIISIYIRHA